VGLYVTASLLCLVQTSGLDLPPARAVAAYICALATGMSVYLLDRVKLTDHLLDPADPHAKPGRYSFIHPRRARLRGLAFVLATVGAATAGFVHPLGVLLVLASFVGIHLYSGRAAHSGPRRRVKDHLLIKNFAVAASITAFAVVLGLLGSVTESRSWPLVVAAAALLAMRIAADAALCDIDDEEADRLFGTRTLPTLIGRERTWLLALAVGLLLVAASWLWPAPAGVRNARLLWSGLPLATGAAIRVWNPAQLRDLIDIRFGLIGLIAAAAQAWGLL
jgi:4-hydroxybenzoate polyprenyltransferase